MRHDAYYEDLRAKIFRKTLWKAAGSLALGSSQAIFLLDKDFNDTTPFVIYDFIVEIYQLFSKPIYVIDVKDGCVSITTHFPDHLDYRNKDFRYLAMLDGAYHSIFRRYSVDKIFLHGFPVVGNINCNRLKVDSLGKPGPY